jgi:hypothetical protein
MTLAVFEQSPLFSKFKIFFKVKKWLKEMVNIG